MATNSPAPNSPDDPARRVRETWDRLAQTPWRDFYIASHHGWDDPSAWTEQALIDVRGYLTGLGRRWLARRQVLEIGCGVGRLAGLLAPLSEGYTGVDISAGMLDEAKRRCQSLPNARFLLGSGAELPIAATDRHYGLVLAVAVFIHCPRELIEGNVRSAWPLLAPGGTFRIQLRVDPTDPESPIVLPEQLCVAEWPLAADEELPLPAPAAGAPRGAIADAVPAEALALAGHRDYAGHAFRVAEARSLLAAAAPGASMLLHRPAPDLLYAVLTRA